MWDIRRSNWLKCFDQYDTEENEDIFAMIGEEEESTSQNDSIDEKDFQIGSISFHNKKRNFTSDYQPLPSGFTHNLTTPGSTYVKRSHKEKLAHEGLLFLFFIIFLLFFYYFFYFVLILKGLLMVLLSVMTVYLFIVLELMD
jgi:hypothetical protein